MEKKTINLSIPINATKEKVWDVLLKDATYRQWVAAFMPGSYAETDWQQGSQVRFISPSGDGLLSKIIEHKPNEIISIEHLANIKNGQEDWDSEEAKKWQGAREIYRVNAKNGVTNLEIEQDIAEEYAEWCTDTWKKALNEIKIMAE